ncbi:MAG: hypothetical protein JSV07_00360 [Acidimicrobiia bacterium]|nr:MAG: hypothetical protein JSV07_00360 [Acidimicrobiia bacterium]
MRSGRFWGGLLMVLAAAAMLVATDDIVTAVPTAIGIVGLSLIAVDARARRR